MEAVISLLHLSDPTLPIGSYVHSNGLEAYVQKSHVHSKETLDNYLRHALIYNYQYNDGAFMCLAYRAAQKGDVQELIRLSIECEALRSPAETRAASNKLGLRLIKIFESKVDAPWAVAFLSAVRQNTLPTHYCLLFGIFAQCFQIPLDNSLQAFYYNTSVSIVTNGVKLIPLGQLQGQEILFSVYGLIGALARSTQRIPRKKIGLANIGFDVRCMQHETLYSRLYMS